MAGNPTELSEGFIPKVLPNCKEWVELRIWSRGDPRPATPGLRTPFPSRSEEAKIDSKGDPTLFKTEAEFLLETNAFPFQIF